jgi:hypothetical protein
MKLRLGQIEALILKKESKVIRSSVASPRNSTANNIDLEIDEKMRILSDIKRLQN